SAGDQRAGVAVIKVSLARSLSSDTVRGQCNEKNGPLASRSFAETWGEQLVIVGRWRRLETTLVDLEGFDLRLERRGGHTQLAGGSERPRYPSLGLLQGRFDHNALLAGVSPEDGATRENRRKGICRRPGGSRQPA